MRDRPAIKRRQKRGGLVSIVDLFALVESFGWASLSMRRTSRLGQVRRRLTISLSSSIVVLLCEKDGKR